MYVSTMTFTDQRVHCGTWTVTSERPLNQCTAIAYAIAQGLAIAPSCKIKITSHKEGKIEHVNQSHVIDLFVPYMEVKQIEIFQHLDLDSDDEVFIDDIVAKHAISRAEIPEYACYTPCWGSGGVTVRVGWED